MIVAIRMVTRRFLRVNHVGISSLLCYVCIYMLNIYRQSWQLARGTFFFFNFFLWFFFLFLFLFFLLDLNIAHVWINIFFDQSIRSQARNRFYFFFVLHGQSFYFIFSFVFSLLLNLVSFVYFCILYFSFLSIVFIFISKFRERVRGTFVPTRQYSVASRVTK